jgi:hypothetical protein
MSARWANALSVFGLVALLAALVITAPRWSRRFRGAIAGPGDERSSSGPAPAPSEGPEAVRKISVKLFFEASDRPGLVIEERTVGLSQDLATQIRSVVEELVRGSNGSLVGPLDPKTKVLSVFVTPRGVAYVDLSREATQLEGGSEDELLAVYSVVDSITANFPSVRKVQILLDDRAAETFAGHVDLSRPLPPDMTLLAETVLRPAAPEAPAAAAPPPPSPQPPKNL